MRSSTILGWIAIQVWPLAAFPHVPSFSSQPPEEVVERSPAPKFYENTAVPFDPALQLVSVSGKNAWKAPNFAAGDQRGPCPGLNALANHNYLPRSGVAPWTNIASACTNVFGLGSDISSFLSVYGAIMDGNILSLDPGYSIGGPSRLMQNILNGNGLIGSPEGLSGSHNKYEADASPARGDLYTFGNDYTVDMRRYNMLYNLSPAPGDYNLDVWKIHRKKMFLKSVHENPQFFYAFFGPVGAQGGYTFAPSMFGNKSATRPDNGLLNRKTLNSFYGVTEQPSGKLTYKQGYERIPQNWYKRHPSNPYDAEKFFRDFTYYGLYYPQILSMGGNTGKVDSFAAMDPGNLTGGVYSFKDLTNPARAKCYMFQTMMSTAPDVIQGRYSLGRNRIMQMLQEQVDKIIGDESCPKVAEVDKSQLKKYPGYKG